MVTRVQNRPRGHSSAGESPSSCWRIQLLCGLSAARDGEVLTQFPTRKTAALLAYLAYHADREHPRDILIELLWPNVERDAARHRLNVALSWLRRRLEPEGAEPRSVLAATHFSVSLNPASVATDVGEFLGEVQAALAAGGEEEKMERLERALARYSGPLLPGFREEWIPAAQEHLGQELHTAVHALVGLHEARGELPRALDAAWRGVQADRHREEAWREWIRLLVAAGRPSEALRQFAELERVLQREVGVPPGPATRALVESLRSEPPASAAHGNTLLPTASLAGAVLPIPRLPTPLTPFIGRERELDRLQAMLAPGASARLVTLTGSGGSGKTRAALEAASRLASPYGGRVWFVPMADVVDGELLAEEIRAVLGVPSEAGSDILETVAAVLASGPALLVLDNLEHLLQAAAPVVGDLLARAPELRCLATSRQRLNLPGEREFPLAPLAVPPLPDAWSGSPETVPLDPDALLNYESVQLFLDRARAINPDFTLTGANAASVGQLCHHLDGVPLAIELAAAWADVLTPGQMLKQLERRFEFLVSPQASGEARHRSLEAACEWSTQRLPERLRRFFARLSLFRGGWTWEAARSICEEAEALSLLAQLRQNSLIVAQETAVRGAGPEMRFRMLETLREYAARTLPPEEAGLLHERHFDWHLALAERAQRTPHGPEAERLTAQLEADLDNVWAALEWCRSTPGRAQQGLRLVGALSWFWVARGHVWRARQYLGEILPREDAQEPTPWRGKALNCAGALAVAQGDHALARQCFEQAIAIFREAGERQLLTMALVSLGSLTYRQGELAFAREVFDQALHVKRETGFLPGITSILCNLGEIARIEGDWGRSRRCYEEALAVARESHDLRCTALSLAYLGMLALELGDLSLAASCLEESHAIRQEVGDPGAIAASLDSLGRVAHAKGDLQRARSYFEASLAIRRDLGDRTGVAACLTGLGRVASDEGDHAAASRMLRDALRTRHSLGERWATLDVMDALARAAAAGEPERAVRLAAASAAAHAAVGYALSPSREAERDSALARCRDALDEHACAAAWEAGSRMDLDEAVAAALDEHWPAERPRSLRP